MQLTVFGNSNLGTEQIFDGMSKWLADISTLDEESLNGLQSNGSAAKGKQCSFTIGHIIGCNGNSVGQALDICCDIAIDYRYFLARIITLLSGTISILNTLLVDDQKTHREFVALSCTRLANGTF